MGEQKQCIECGGPLPQHAAANSKYCSPGCWKAANKQRQRGKSGSELAQARARITELEADKARLVAALEFYAKLEGNGQNFRVVEPSKDGSFVSMGNRARAELDAVKETEK